jgi:hypothetical protein
LAGFSLPEAEKFFGRPRGLDGAAARQFHSLSPLAPPEAATLYLDRFKRLAP